MIIGPRCLMNAFYLFLSYCSRGMELMAWNEHFVKRTNRVTHNDSDHQVQWGLRKMLSGACNDEGSEKEGTLEMREGVFLIASLGR